MATIVMVHEQPCRHLFWSVYPRLQASHAADAVAHHEHGLADNLIREVPQLPIPLSNNPGVRGRRGSTHTAVGITDTEG